MSKERIEAWLRHELSLANYSIGAGAGLFVFLFANVEKLARLPDWSLGFTIFNLILVGMGIWVAVVLRVVAANGISGIYIAASSPGAFVRFPFSNRTFSNTNSLAMLLIVVGAIGLIGTVVVPVLLSEMSS